MATMRALAAHETRTASANAALSPARRAAALASRKSKKAGSSISAYLAISARPADRSRAGSVSSTPRSASTSTGWWNRPTMFLPARELIAVLPPTDESTWARSVVGTCTKRAPRLSKPAASPVRSPTTPPPKARIRSSRSAPCEISASSTVSSVEKDFEPSPGGIVTTCGVTSTAERALLSVAP